MFEFFDFVVDADGGRVAFEVPIDKANKNGSFAHITLPQDDDLEISDSIIFP